MVALSAVHSVAYWDAAMDDAMAVHWVDLLDASMAAHWVDEMAAN